MDMMEINGGDLDDDGAGFDDPLPADAHQAQAPFHHALSFGVHALPELLQPPV
jgi:hypothetical protein